VFAKLSISEQQQNGDGEMSMNDDMNSKQEMASNADAVRADQTTNPNESLEGESCSQACRLHSPMRLASIVIIAGLLGLYALLHFSPALANFIPNEMFSWVGLDAIIGWRQSGIGNTLTIATSGRDSSCMSCSTHWQLLTHLHFYWLLS